MKCLIIYGHPNPKSFNHAILETLVQALQGLGHETRVRDLYAMKFDPVLKAKDFSLMAKQKVSRDVQKEQFHVRWAEVIVFIFPVWWNSLPAITRGYVDRVLSVGFAYSEDAKGLLPGKKVLVIATMNAPQVVCEKAGVLNAMDITIGQSLAGFCGMILIKQKYFNSVASVTDAERGKMLDEVMSLAKEIK
jgi:NAD(P)H dehydrogenase (quinone)